MLFRLDFKEKLDLSNFRKHAAHYIGKMRELTYHLVLPNYKILIEIASPDDQAHLVTLSFFDIKRDQDGEMLSEHVIIPLVDTRFRETKIIKDIFPVDHYRATFSSTNKIVTVERICQLTKLVHKINHLKAFL